MSSEDLPPPLPPKDVTYNPSPNHISLSQKRINTGAIHRPKPTSSSSAPSSPVVHRSRRLQSSRSNPDDRAKLLMGDSQQVGEDEAGRQSRLKLAKELAFQEYLEEEKQRKVALEEEMRYAARIQRMKAERDRLAEENARRYIEEVQRKDKEKRIQVGQEMQRWRSEMRRKSEDTQREILEARKQRDIHRRARSMVPQDGYLFTGWITFQADSLVSRRRFCRLRGPEMRIYKDITSDSAILLVIDLTKLKTIVESEDHCEELEGLPDAFILRTSEQSYFVFPDSSEQKEDIIAAILQSTQFPTA